MPNKRAPVECRLKKNPTVVRIFLLKVGEQPPNKDWERVPENTWDVLDQYYSTGKMKNSVSITNRR